MKIMKTCASCRSYCALLPGSCSPLPDAPGWTTWRVIFVSSTRLKIVRPRLHCFSGCRCPVGMGLAGESHNSKVKAPPFRASVYDSDTWEPRAFRSLQSCIKVSPQSNFKDKQDQKNIGFLVRCVFSSQQAKGMVCWISHWGHCARCLQSEPWPLLHFGQCDGWVI